MQNRSFKSVATVNRGKIVAFLTIIFPLLVVCNAIFRPLLVHPERGFFFGFILVLVFLLTPLKSRGAARRKIYLIIDSILIIIAIASAAHIMFNWEYFTVFMGKPRPIDMTLGILVTLVTLEATRRTMMPFVPVAIAFLLYALFGQNIPGLMGAPPLSIERLIQQIYLTLQGLMGLTFNVGLKYIVPFLIMGCLMKAMQTMDIFSDFVNIFVGRTVGGPAKLSVVTSGMFGMMSGSSVANVAFTGTFTIPLMKRYGYTPEFAAGVEAASSLGGGLMPPILGSAAFIMADMIGVPYVRIMLAAFVPALLYYLAVFLRVHYKAKQESLRRPSEDITGRIQALWKTLPRLIPFTLALIILVYGLFTWTPTRAAVITIVALIPLSFLRYETRLTPRRIIAGLQEATYSFKTLGAALICAGILLAIASATGLALKFSEVLIGASGGNRALLVLWTAVALLIMGMGLGGTAVYIFGAVMLGPALVKVGVPILLAHFMIFYYSNIQGLTPPVCITAYTAATIAKANLAKGAIAACSIGILGFFMPFLIIYYPELLLVGSWVGTVRTTLFMAVATVAGTFVLGGYFNRQLSLLERALFLVATGMIVAPLGYGYAFKLAGVVMTGVLLFISTIVGRRSQTLPEGD